MLVISILAAALYLALAVLQYRQVAQQKVLSRKLMLGGVLLAVCLHGISAWQSVITDEGVNLGLFKISALIFWIINLSFLISLLRRPLQNLALILFPLSALSVMISALAPGNSSPLSSLSTGMLVHISSSILAYAVLTIAACQAAAVALLDRALRQRHTRGVMQILPPLQLMEAMLFEILWLGLVLLTLSIGSGALFVEDMFAQHLVHKTVLTICAWLVFATLLWGHHQLGWRSQTAVRMTLGGFAVLMLAYFGSKLVLEVILQRV